jgi:hypothetical protein
MIQDDRTIAVNPDGHNRSLNHSHLQDRALTSATDLRVIELEIENTRLQRLVAELLLKNQQLRKESEPETV